MARLIIAAKTSKSATLILYHLVSL